MTVRTRATPFLTTLLQHSTLSQYEQERLAYSAVLLITLSDVGERWTYIFDSLLGAPPVTLATLRAPSSCFRSFNYRP